MKTNMVTVAVYELNTVSQRLHTVDEFAWVKQKPPLTKNFSASPPYHAKKNLPFVRFRKVQRDLPTHA
jgi:hypothetical protein